MTTINYLKNIPSLNDVERRLGSLKAQEDRYAFQISEVARKVLRLGAYLETQEVPNHLDILRMKLLEAEMQLCSAGKMLCAAEFEEARKEVHNILENLRI